MTRSAAVSGVIRVQRRYAVQIRPIRSEGVWLILDNFLNYLLSYVESVHIPT